MGFFGSSNNNMNVDPLSALFLQNVDPLSRYMMNQNPSTQFVLPGFNQPAQAADPTAGSMALPPVQTPPAQQQMLASIFGAGGGNQQLPQGMGQQVALGSIFGSAPQNQQSTLSSIFGTLSPQQQKTG